MQGAAPAPPAGEQRADTTLSGRSWFTARSSCPVEAEGLHGRTAPAQGPAPRDPRRRQCQQAAGAAVPVPVPLPAEPEQALEKQQRQPTAVPAQQQPRRASSRLAQLREAPAPRRSRLSEAPLLGRRIEVLWMDGRWYEATVDDELDSGLHWLVFAEDGHRMRADMRKFRHRLLLSSDSSGEEEEAPGDGQGGPAQQQAPAPPAAGGAAGAAAEVPAATWWQKAVLGGRQQAQRGVRDCGAQQPSRLAARQWGGELVGRRVAVYWPEDGQWYSGFVADFSSASKRHFVLYGDGDEELLLLHQERVELLEDAQEPARGGCAGRGMEEQQGGGGSRGEDGGPSGEPPRKRRRGHAGAAAPAPAAGARGGREAPPPAGVQQQRSIQQQQQQGGGMPADSRQQPPELREQQQAPAGGAGATRAAAGVAAATLRGSFLEALRRAAAAGGDYRAAGRQLGRDLPLLAGAAAADLRELLAGLQEGYLEAVPA